MPNAALSAAKTLLSSIGKRPLRLVLQVVSTCVGTGALALALGVSARLDGFVSTLDSGGRRIAIANASVSSSDTGTGGQSGIEWQNPAVFTTADAAAFKSASSAIRDVSIVNNMNWDQIQANGRSWRVRRVLASDDRYAAVMGLDLVAGSFFSRDDVSKKNRVVAVSASSAETLFGGVDAALGKTLMVDRGIRQMRNVIQGTVAGQGAAAGGAAATTQRNAASGATATAITRATAARDAGFASNRVQSAMESYTIVAVYKDVADFERSAYGIPDMVIPWTTMFPSNFPGSATVRTLVARADSTSLLRIGADLRVDVARRLGDGAKVMVWEGDAARPQADTLGRARSALADFSALAQALGGLILAIACFGIASGIAVEAADRSKEIAIRRAVGLTVLRSSVAFCIDGTVTAALGSLIGLGAALAFYDPVGRALDPYLTALGLNLGSLGGGLPARALLAPLAAVVAAFLFSLLPALRASSGSIADSLKE
jgi:putative ABC transport system permease protein